MSIPGRHYYRHVYLKSEHWANLRLEKLASVDAKCERCGERDLSNDVHHVNYRNLYDVELSDLLCLCRKCHDLTHEVLELCRAGDEAGLESLRAGLAIAREQRREVRGKRDKVRQSPQLNHEFRRMRLAGKIVQ